ncbi:MAG: hypothetical protein H8E20_00335 [Verrucomicrobia bacterium]|nr:hypothetical protein [Verrucomicrobiota bacterium]
MKLLNIVTAAVLAGTVGCASIVSKNQYPVSFQSNPSGAMITITDKNGNTIASGTTPYTLTLSAKSGAYQAAEYTLTLEKDGYQITHSKLNASLDGWYFGNIIFGGLLGILIIDPITGSMWKLPSNHVVNLSVGNADSGVPTLKIIELSQLTEEQRGQLVAVKLN